MDIKEKTISFLRTNNTGAENAMQKHLLCSLCNTDEETLRNNINKLRADGYPICSNRQGFYLATNHSDIDLSIAMPAVKIRELTRAQEGLCYARNEFRKTIIPEVRDEGIQ